ncbi:MAG: MFS transporter [Pseudomonadota bacterium]
MSEPRRLSVPTMISFGVGEASGAFANTTWGVLLLFYYQQVVGVEAAMVGLAIAISVMLDAVSDPLVGTWSDQLTTRWGRRHPLLVASALPLAVSFVLLFTPPAGMTDLQGFLWLMTFGILTRFFYTFYNIPHLALGAEMAQDYYQRSTLFAYSSFVGAMSVAVVYGLITGLFFPTTPEFDPGFLNAAAYPFMSICFASVMVAAILICAIGTRGEIAHLRKTQIRPRIGLFTVFTEMRAVFGNLSFRAIFFGLVLGSLVGGVESAFMPFMGIHFWGFRTEDLFYLTFVGLFGFPVAFVLIPFLTRVLDKRMAVMLPLASWIIAVNTPICLRLLDVSWFPDNSSAWILPIFLAASTVGALASPIIGATTNSMLADVADEHELESGVRREGVLYSVRAFTSKATAAFGTLFGGILLSWIEFPAHAVRGEIDSSTIWSLGLIAGPATSIFSLAALGFYFMYRINHKRHLEIVEQLSSRRRDLAVGATETVG